jgi:tetratricopeptide (TPR) repeat protein
MGKTVAALMLLGAAVLGFASSTGWFRSRSGGTVARVDQDSENTAAETTQEVAPDSRAATPATEVSANLPPLDALAPTESNRLIEECRRVSEHLVRTFPNSVDAMEMQARFEFELGKVDAAGDLWRQILERNPRSVYALRGLGDIATQEGHFGLAVQQFRKTVLVDPGNLSHQLRLGVALLAAQELEEAKSTLEAVVARGPKYVEAQRELGTVLLQLQDFEGARNQFEAALAVDPNHAKTHYGLATAYSRLGNREKALHHQSEHQRLNLDVKADLRSGRRGYDDFAALQETIARLYTDMARVYLSAGDTRSAEFLLRRVTRIQPSDIDSRQAMAFLANTQGKTRDAIRWLRNLAELRPDEFAFPQEIVSLYLQLNQPGDAARALTEFVDSHPNHTEAIKVAAHFFLEAQTDLAKATQYGTAYAEQAPSPESFALLSGIHEANEKWDAAIVAIEQAVKLAPNDAAYRQYLALLREKASSTTLKSPDRP